MPDWLSILILGLVEGVTEFLPVSSTGHLLLVEHWIGHRSEFFNVIIQSAAVLAVMAAFRERLGQLMATHREPATRAYLAKIAVAFVITGVGGLALKKAGLRLNAENPVPVATATLVGGVLFLVVEHWLKGRKTMDDVPWAAALAVAASVTAWSAVPCAVAAAASASSASSCAARAAVAALVAAVFAAAAAAAASVAALSVTATHALPFQRFGVLAPPVVSIHSVVAFWYAAAGAVVCMNTSALDVASPAASAAAAAAASAVD